MITMNDSSSESWTSQEGGPANGSTQLDHIQGSSQSYAGHNSRNSAFRPSDKSRLYADGSSESFRSSKAGAASLPGRRHRAPVEVRAQAASELLASEDPAAGFSSGSGGSSGSPTRTLPQRRHTMPASMLPPLVVPAFRPPIQWTVSIRSRGEASEASPGLTSPGHNKANGHMASPSTQAGTLTKPRPIRASIQLEKPADISTTPGSPVTVGKGPTGMQPSPMSPTENSPSTARSVPSPADAHSQTFSGGNYRGAFMNSPDYLKAAGDLHYPSPMMLNRSLPNPGGLLRAQSMPVGFAKQGGSLKQELDPQGRVQELCSAAREGDHSMVRALLQGAKPTDRIIDAVDEATGLTALHEAVLGGHYDMVIHLLMDGEADPDAKLSSQGPPLLHAVQTNNEKMVDILLNAGAAIDGRDLSDSTALHTAASMGHRKILKKLLTAGANAGLRNRDGRTAMDCAANEKTQHVFEKYLQRNPNVDLSEQSDVTPGSSSVGEAGWEGYSDPEGRGRNVMSPPRGVMSPPSSHSHRGQWKPPPDRAHKAYDASPRPTPKSKSFTHGSTSGVQNYSTSAPSQSHTSHILSPPKSLVSPPNSYYPNGGFDSRWKGQPEAPPQEENIHHSFDSTSSTDTVQERPEENFLEEALSKVKEGKVVGINPLEAERMAREARGARSAPSQDQQRRAAEKYESQGGGGRTAGQRMRSISDTWERYHEEAPPPRQYQNVPWPQIPLLRSLSGEYPASFQSASDPGGNEFSSQNRNHLSRTVSENMAGRFDMGSLSRTLGAPPGYHHQSGSMGMEVSGGRALAQTSYMGRDPWGGYLTPEGWAVPPGGGRRSSEFHAAGGDVGHQFPPPTRMRQSGNPTSFHMERPRGGDPPKLLERHGSVDSAKPQGFEAVDRALPRGKSEPGFSLASQSSRSRFGSTNSAFSAVGGEKSDWQSSRSGRRSEGGLPRPSDWEGETSETGTRHVHRRSWDERASGDERDWLSRSNPPHQHDSRTAMEGGRFSESYWEAGAGRLPAESGGGGRARNPPPLVEVKSPFSPTPPGSTPVSPRARARVSEQVYLTPKPPTTAHNKVPTTSPPAKALLKESPAPLLTLAPSASKPVTLSLAPTPPAAKPAGPPQAAADISKPETPAASPSPPPESSPAPVKLPPALKKPASSSGGGSDSGGASEGKAGPPVKKGVQFDIKDIELIRKDWQEEASKNGCVACGKPECDGSCNSAIKVKDKAVMPPSAKSLFDAAETKQTGSFVWTRGELLGEGAYGKVFAGLNQENGQLMAVKQLKLNDSDQSREYQRHVAALEREISLYRKMRHRHIVGYINMERDDASGSLYVFLEYVSGGSIHSMLERFGRFSEPLVRVYTRQLLQGLEYLHECKIIHRDIKGGNVLVDRDGVIKLADFGASKAFHDATLTDGCKSIRGSVFWMAPEVIKGDGYGRRADIWSVGCTVIEMLTGSHPWPGIDNTWTAIFHIAKALTGPPMPEIASPLAREFLNLCFALDPKERPTATDLLQHPFVAQAGEVVQAPAP